MALVREFEKTIRLNMFYAMNKFIEPESRTERQSHEELVDLLKTDDPEEAEKIIRYHVRSGKRNLYKDVPDYHTVFSS